MTISDDRCPDCGAMMILRLNTRTKAQFWGCSTFPKCSGTREVDDEDGQPADEMPSDRYRRADWRNDE